MTQIVSTGTSGMGKKPQSMRAQPPTSPQEKTAVQGVWVYGQQGHGP